ncbi:MAG: metallophosphoesterase [Gammaproteobacteria bacterium]|nr:metallophosphoesterase [Gammaproteobacteria bacterium]MDH3434094.1 metallophosphoesterase [Gammaproteobacteria bacterium]
MIALLLCLCASLSSAQTDEWHFSGVERIVAVGDVHGAYDALVATLQNAAIIDEELAWSGGKTHLVMTGDLLDRGPYSRRVMDLIMRLEHEASLAGGRVHQLLGNHEVMNLIGDLRYVSSEEYAAFRDDEKARERKQWYKQFRNGKTTNNNEATIRAEFDKKAPPGYFGHRRAFRHDGVYGSWLLHKPLMVVINQTAFVHGGMPPLVAEQGLAGVNIALKKDLHDFVTARAELEDAAVINPIDGFRTTVALLVAKMNAGQVPEVLEAAAQQLVDRSKSPLHGPAGPTWYRGTATCNRLIEGDALNLALSRISAKRVVMGHTSTSTRQVQQRMNGRIITIDTGMLKSHYEGSGNALIIESDKLRVVHQDGGKALPPLEHPLRVGHESLAIDDSELAEILENGDVFEIYADGGAWRLVQVTAGEISVYAYFNARESEQSFDPELAAYKLDRLLGLGMVPVTVRREIAGRQGTLQFVPAATLTERARVAAGQWLGAPCALRKQMGAMYVFDALIHNPTRTPSSMLYSPDDWLLILVDHENSFNAVDELPAYLQGVELAVGHQWRTALLELNDAVLHAELGDMLDERQLAALGRRRDALVRDAIH